MNEVLKAIAGEIVLEITEVIFELLFKEFHGVSLVLDQTRYDASNVRARICKIFVARSGQVIIQMNLENA
ncbi:MAG: hypothetical protein COT74_01200 [Bdellovibrionales bacterium CG10_big_fil_rev_8_21_14_0_10_45_34]|nr:MAG: hypothetical protein COT74_01200 [Bdellovibrionales bacterium CG10_big_fil_rev_8_21_14_0_10_45_34]